MIYRDGNKNDIGQLRELGLISWSQFKEDLTPAYWQKLLSNLSDENTYAELLQQSHCVVCENDEKVMIGMAFLVPSGNPTDIYLNDWCYIRFVSVHPQFSGKGIGRQLTQMCIEKAKKNNEETIALHTSEMMRKARHLYETLGFKILREIEPRLGKKYWLYTLDLKEYDKDAST